MRSGTSILKTLSLPYDICITAFKTFHEDNCFTLSSSISYIFLFSIIPFSTLSIFVFNAIQRTFFSGEIWANKLVDLIVDELIHVIPFVTKSWVKTYIINPKAYGSFTMFSFLLLPIISGLIFHELEISYRKIFKLPSRHLLLGQIFYSISSIFAVLLLYTSNFLWLIISSAASHFQSFLNTQSYLKDLLSFTSFHLSAIVTNVVSLIVLVIFFLATVKIFLNIKIRMKYRLLSAALFSILWIFARELFKLYLLHISRVNLLYGSLSSVILILLWIYYASAALLYSLEVMYVLHSGQFKR
ncbi:MAG: YihY/virulence factor BrkB family protein [Desulfobacterales bacterium]|jgi:membrane protein|nr:YihY/virulence factor BrkB family protein [Desulfobacterales bacterium]